MDLKQLRVYDGSDNGGNGRVCVAVNGKIFDVTRVIFKSFNCLEMRNQTGMT